MQKITALSLFLLYMFLGINRSLGQGTITLTYNDGIIPTSLGSFDESCNGPSTTLKFSLPAGENIDITGFDVSYNIQAAGANLPTAQRSAIFCQNTNQAESTQSGVFTVAGATQTYSRTGVNIANGTYPGGTEIVLEMRAWRTTGGTGCGTSEQYVLNNSWSVTLYYGAAYNTPLVGVNTNTPESVLDVNGKLKLSDDNASVVEGNVRYNDQEQDFEGYDGTSWRSFTGKEKVLDNDFEIDESDLSLIPNPNAAYSFFGIKGNKVMMDDQTLIVTNSQQVYLYEQLDEDFELKDSVATLDGTVEFFEYPNVIIRSYNTFRTYSIANGAFALVSTEVVSVVATIQNVTFSGDFCYIGSFGFASPAIGDVKIYNTTTTPWTLEQTLHPPTTPVTNDRFGSAIHQYNDKLYIGAPQFGIVGADILGSGEVYVYEKMTGIWQLSETITSPNSADNWKFGINIKSKDNELFIGSDPSFVSDNGTIAVYDIGSAGHTLKYEITSPNPQGGFAYRFDVYDNVLFVSTDQVSSSSLSAFVYEKGTTWTLIHKMSVPETSGFVNNNVGISNTHLFWAVEKFGFPEHGIYFLNRDDFNPIDFSSLTNLPPGIADGDDVNDADHDPGNEKITSMSILNDELFIAESGNSLSVDLSPIATQWEDDGADIYFNNRVGIGVSNPQESLDVDGTLQVTKNSSSGNPHLNIVEDGADFIRLYMENNTGNRAVIAANPKTDTDESVMNFFLDGAGDVMTIKGNERVGINTMSPEVTFHIKHDIGTDKGLRLENTASDWWRFYVSSSSSNLQLFNPSNSIVARGTFNYTSGAYTSASDRRLKTAISDLHFNWEKFMGIRPVNYIFKSDDAKRKQLGLIAQDFSLIYPELVHYNHDEDTYKLDYSGTGVVAIKAIQELYQKNQQLHADNDLLKSELETLKAQLQNDQLVQEQRMQALEEKLEATLLQFEQN